MTLVAAFAALSLAGCSQPAPAAATTQSSPKTSGHVLAGGCAGTVVTDREPPMWAQGGWTNPHGQPWGVPWAFGTGDNAVAYLFATQLVAGASPRADGTNNKVLWESRDSPSGAGVMIEAHPFGQSQPVVTISGGPSIVDVPTAGCWTFRLSWNASGQHSSAINLEVLPAGTVP